MAGRSPNKDPVAPALIGGVSNVVKDKEETLQTENKGEDEKRIPQNPKKL